MKSLKNDTFDVESLSPIERRIRNLCLRRPDVAARHPEWHHLLTKSELKEVASIAVRVGDKLLMGKRNDNQRWTLPGGHLDQGEKPKAAAIRELKEEAGLTIPADKVKKLGSQKVTTFTGKKMKIHAFEVRLDEEPKTSTKNDPDNEVKKWEFVVTKDGLPENIKDNLHSPKNIVLKKIGLQKGKNIVTPKDEMIEEHEHLVDVLESPSHKDDKKEAKKQKKELAEYRKSEAFVIDLIKARSHKYIKKIMRGGQWVYIYHEGEHKKELSATAIEMLKKIADAGDEHAKHLLENIKTEQPAEKKKWSVGGIKIQKKEDGKFHVMHGNWPRRFNTLEEAQKHAKNAASMQKLITKFKATFRNPVTPYREGSDRGGLHISDDGHGHMDVDRYRRHDHGGGPNGDDWLPDHEVEADYNQGVREHNHKLHAFNMALKQAGFEGNAQWDLGEKGHFAIVFHLKKKGSGSVRRSEVFEIDLAKSEALDLIKARPHKYLRKYQRGGKWIYIYHEGDQHGRQISEEAYHHIKTLAEHGDEHAKALHDTLEEHKQEKLDLLRKLADHGDEAAHKHLKTLGIDRDKEKLEEQLIPAQVKPKDEMDEENHPHLEQMKQNVKNEVQAAVQHLNGHRETPIARAIHEHLQKPELLHGVQNAKTKRELLDATHKMAKHLEQKQGDIRAERPGDRKTYGNDIYHRAMAKHVQSGALPQEYADEHKREARAETHEHKDIGGIRERAEQRRREQEERDRREYGVYADKVREMEEHFGKTLTPEQRKHMAKGIKTMFGEDFSMKHFDSCLNPDPTNKSKIVVSDSFFEGIMGAGRSGNTSISFSFTFKDRQTNATITTASRSLTKRSDGSLSWSNGVFHRPSNDKLRKYSGMSKGLYGGVENFLKEVTKNYPASAKKNCDIHMYAANSGFGDGYKGALLWAKHYYAFNHAGDARSWASTYEDQVSTAKRALPHLAADLDRVKAKLRTFKHPYEFVKLGIPVTKEEAIRFVGRELDFDFNQIYAAKPTCDLGEIMLIKSRQSFDGINYFNRTEGDAGHLNEKRTAYYQQASAPASSSARATGAPTRTYVSQRVREHVEGRWKPRGKSIVLTAQRINALQTWPKEDVREFYSKAPLTRAAKRRVKEILDRIGG